MPMPPPRFRRVAESQRPIVALTVDGRAVEALEGDTLLTVLMRTRGAVRAGEFGDGPRGGFCAMGACQDCWVALADGRRVRACTTAARPGMSVSTGLGPAP